MAQGKPRPEKPKQGFSSYPFRVIRPDIRSASSAVGTTDLDKQEHFKPIDAVVKLTAGGLQPARTIPSCKAWVSGVADPAADGVERRGRSCDPHRAQLSRAEYLAYGPAMI